MKSIFEYKSLVFFAFFLSASVVSCQIKKQIVQDDKIELNNYGIVGAFLSMDIDKLGNIYLVDSKNNIYKYDQNYEQLFSNSYNTLGKISHIDVSNPQKILVYFSDFQNILFLDNTLSEIKILNLESMGYWNIQAVAPSVDNFIWIYDPVNFRLVKISENGEVLNNSNELYSDGIHGTNTPIIVAKDDRIYLCTEEQIMIFNIFGELLKTMSIPNNGLQFIQSKVIFLDDGKLKARDIKTEFLIDSDMLIHDIYNEIRTNEVRNNEVRTFYLDKSNQLFILDNKGVMITALHP